MTYVERADYNQHALPACATSAQLWRHCFCQVSALALQHNAVNLVPEFSRARFCQSRRSTSDCRRFNQYARSAGHPRLVKALAVWSTAHFLPRIEPDD